jgi:hypothetical protein
MTAPSDGTPPKAPITFRVGVVGHRPDRLGAADLPVLDQVVERLLREVQGAVAAFADDQPSRRFYADTSPAVRMVSSLAEGADRLLATKALELGWELCCPLPFPQSEYERDFGPNRSLEPHSLESFRSLLERARKDTSLVVFELDGARAEEQRAYAAAARVVLNQSDLLVAIWDGREERGPGGTAQSVREAMRLQVPVVWIDAVAPHACQLLDSPHSLPPIDAEQRCVPSPCSGDSFWPEVRRRVGGTLAWPTLDEAVAEAYFAELRPRWNGGFVWKVFRDLIGNGRCTLPALRVAPFELDLPATRRRPTADDLTLPATVADWVNLRLRAHFVWSDKLGDLYADRYRSAYVLTYGLAALAVLLALLPGTLGGGEAARGVGLICAAGELVSLGVIFAAIYTGRRFRWHERWLQYRLVAELVRQQRFLAPLGGIHSHVRMPDHQASWGNPAGSWMFAHVRAVVRAVGLPNLASSAGEKREDPTRELLEHLRAEMREQKDFHEQSARCYHHLELRLHRISAALLSVTVVAVILHLLAMVPGWAWLHFSGPTASWLMFCAAGLPAVGAALTGISNQGEFVRAGKRSQAMRAHFVEIERELQTLLDRSLTGGAPASLEEAALLARKAARLMVGEVLDWRVIFLDQTPRLPA